MFGKLEKYLFYLLLFSIPFQVRKILWFDGWRFNEWQSISVYATDFLLFVLLGFWLFNFLYKTRDKKYEIKSYDFLLLIFLVISAISIKNTDVALIGWFQWLKLLEFVLFFYYLKTYAFNKFGLYNSFFAIFIGGLFQALIAIIQFIKQSSIGLRYFGEGIINSDLPGIASFYLSNGEKIIRSYGTTPHSNILAGFLFLSLTSFYFVYLYSHLDNVNKKNSESNIAHYVWSASYVVVLLGFFTTFSRTVGFIWFVAFCIRAIAIRSRKYYRLLFGTQEGRKRIKIIIMASLFAIAIFGSVYFDESLARLSVSSEEQAVKLRTFYTKEALGFNVNLFGVGLGNFVNHLINQNPYLDSYIYQPVHNIYLLIYSETGTLGIIAFLAFLFLLVKDFISRTKLAKSYHLSFLIFFSSILFIGFFDHFLWTLQQGRFVLWVALAMLAIDES